MTEQPPSARATRDFAFALAAATAVVLLLPVLDPWVFAHVRRPGVYDRDWGRLLRIMGFAPTWLLGAAVLLLARRGVAATRGRRAANGPGLFLVAAIAATGLVGELVKLVVRRERPAPNGGLYAFLPWNGDWSTGAVGFPSTHAIVAFAGAFAMARLSPRSAPVWILLGAGCGLTRLLDGKHFLSDVLAAAVLAWGLVAVLWDAMGPERLDPA